MNKESIPYRIWHRIVRATKTNDAQVNSVATMWFITSVGLATRQDTNIPIWYCIAFGFIWVIIAFIINLISPLDMY